MLDKLIKLGGRTVGRTALTIQKHSPEILTGVAVVGVVATAVLASRAVGRARNVVLDMQYDVSELRDRDDISESEINKDVAHRYMRGSLEIAKIYAPTVTMGITTVGCILGAHGIMKKRHVAIVAAYKTLESTFSEYRERMIEELGPEREEEVRNLVRTEEVEDPETGEKKKIVRGRLLSPYSRVFDESNMQWQSIPDYNELFLRGQQNYANDMLKARGHITLNDVYDRLGFDRTPEGQLVGWVWGGDGDNFVDFGLDRIQYKDGIGVSYDTGAITLDFNVDGLMYEMIK